MWRENLQEKLPGSLIEYIHKSHLTYILTILRKIYEPKKKGHRKVNSIPTLINLIESKIGCWTRENYVCYDRTPYQDDEINDWRVNATIKERHHRFDKMAGTIIKSNRQRNDKLLPEIIHSIKRESLWQGWFDKYWMTDDIYISPEKIFASETT